MSGEGSKKRALIGLGPYPFFSQSFFFNLIFLVSHRFHYLESYRDVRGGVEGTHPCRVGEHTCNWGGRGSTYRSVLFTTSPWETE